MRAVIQRVSCANVSIDGNIVSQIGKGVVVLLAIGRDDTEHDINYIVEKTINMRIFEKDGKFDLSLLDVDGEILLVSQFTLYGDVRKGRRPSFTDSMPPANAKILYEKTFTKFSEFVPTKQGEFQAHMCVNLINDGPVTILLDSKKNF